jgi:DNA-binding transcriptional regulator LsrR (DeoR family)
MKELSRELNMDFQGEISSPCVIVGEVENRYSPKDEDRIDAAAAAAADYFLNVVPQSPRADEDPQADKEKPLSGWIGVSGGNTMLRVVQHIIKRKKGQYVGLRLIPLAGEAEPDKFEISANSVVLRLAEACAPGKAKTYSLMTTPIVGAPLANNKGEEDHIDRFRKNLETSSGIEEVIKKVKQVKFAFTGIGGKEDEESALARLNRYCVINEKEIPKGIVGDICYRPIDMNGKDAWPELSRRLVGPNLDDLREMSKTPNFRRVFAVACGEEKADPIIAAFRGGLVNGLITDELTALDILQRLDEILLALKEQVKEKKEASVKANA